MLTIAVAIHFWHHVSRGVLHKDSPVMISTVTTFVCGVARMFSAGHSAHFGPSRNAQGASVVDDLSEKIESIRLGLPSSDLAPYFSGSPDLVSSRLGRCDASVCQPQCPRLARTTTQHSLASLGHAGEGPGVIPSHPARAAKVFHEAVGRTDTICGLVAIKDVGRRSGSRCSE